MPPWIWLVLLLSGAVTWTVLGWMLHTGTAAVGMDEPNARSLHTRPTPRTGGIGVMVGVFAGWLALGLLGLGIEMAVALPALGLFAVSLVDDLRNLSIRVRLACQLVAAGALMWALQPGGGDSWIAALAVLAIVWMTNLYNFMDGADGIAGGMAVFGFGAYGLAAALAGGTHLGLAAMCGGVVMAALAFLRFNFHPARIFMGDCGSIPLGFLAGAIGVIGWRDAIWPAWFPPLVFMPFVFDATLTLLRRMGRGDKFWQAHREHAYQKLVRMGLGHRNTALVEYVAMALTAAVALTALALNEAARWLMLATTLLAYVALAAWVERKWRAWERRQA